MSKHEQILLVIGGGLLSALDSIKFENIVVTIIMAIIGTTISFFLTQFYKWVIKKIKS